MFGIFGMLGMLGDAWGILGNDLNVGGVSGMLGMLGNAWETLGRCCGYLGNVGDCDRLVTLEHSTR